MSTSTVHTLATWKVLAKEVWGEVQQATVTLSARYTDLAVAKPQNATVKELYVALPKAWQDKCTEGSFVATFSLAVKVVKAFTKAQKEGLHSGFTATTFVEKCGSLAKAEKVLFPAKAEGKKPADPKVGGEGNGETEESEGADKGAKAEKVKADTAFARACQVIDEMNETDLTTLSLYVADRLAKFQSKALAVKA